MLARGKGCQDDVFTTLLVWHIDIGEYEQAVQIATYALQHKMTLPDQYRRDIPTMLMDEFAGAYLHDKLANDVNSCVGWARFLCPPFVEHGGHKNVPTLQITRMK